MIRILALCLAGAAGGCLPHSGECDEELARRVVYTHEDGLPAYAGQALVQSSCGDGSFCHAEAALGSERYGAPGGLDFDLALAETAEEVERLRRGQRQVYRWRRQVLAEVTSGDMPPGEAGRLVARVGVYADLPPLAGPEGIETLRNWLACGAPVVERTSPYPPGVEPVGAVIAALPAGAEPCAADQQRCDGVCVGVGTDPLHCGACGRACASAQLCIDGACAGCEAGLSECDGACVDVRGDARHCGDCGAVCGADAVCAGGACSTEGCPEGLANCDGSCVDLATSPLHCGACASRCAAGQSCVSGACDCGDVSSDVRNCGECGRVCPAGTTCVAGECACAEGSSRCGERCIDTRADPANCGACGASCAPDQSCEAGRCVACGSGVSFRRDVQPIFDDNCTESLCHAGARPAGDLRLVSGVAHGALVGMPSGCRDGRLLVDPGRPDASYLMDKLLGERLCRGDRMPLRAPPLSSARLELIRAWICGGARDD